MWRFLVGGVAALLMVGAVMLFLGKRARSDSVLPALSATAPPVAQASDPLPDTVPEASEKTREQKRFDRYDKDRDGKITRDEYLMARHKAFAKLDRNGDGVLQFDEWAAKAETKFATADSDKSGTLTPTEFATTAVKRKAARRVKCPQREAAAPPEAKEDEG